jgi:hypothetical protein
LDSEEMRTRLEGLFVDWDAFYESCTPVEQADALLTFANAFYHFTETVKAGWVDEDAGEDGFDVSNGHLVGVHDPVECAGRYCCIHNPSDHPMRNWEQLWRDDRGLMERVCEHGIGHPDPDDPKSANALERMHGCDGCCAGSYDALEL